MVGGREGQRFISVCEEWSCYYGVSSSGQTARLSSSGDMVTMLTFVRADSDGLMPGHFFSGDLNVVYMLAEIHSVQSHLLTATPADILPLNAPLETYLITFSNSCAG